MLTLPGYTLYLDPGCFASQSHGKGDRRVHVAARDTDGDVSPQHHSETVADVNA